MKKTFNSRFRKFVAICTVAVLAMGILAGCSSSGAASSKTESSTVSSAAPSTTSSGVVETAKKLGSLTASGQPYSHTLPAWLGIKDGKFKEAGMDFNVIMFTGGAAQNEALGADEWEVGTMGSPPAINGGIAYGVHVIGFGSTDNKAVTIWARPDSEITKISGQVKDHPDVYGNADAWRGKTVLCPTSSTAHFTLVATLKALGLTTNDIKLIDMSVPQAFTAFKAGEADIVCLWDPQGFDAEAEGWKKISSSEATGADLPTVIVASEKAIKEKHDELLEYLDIYITESEKYGADLTAYGQAMKDVGDENGVKQTLEVATKCAANRPLPTLQTWVDWYKGDVGKRKADIAMQALMDFFVYTGTIEESGKQKLMSSNFIDSSFVEELCARRGIKLN